MRSFRPWLLAGATAAGLVLSMQPAMAAPAPASDGLSSRARSQIEALAKAKADRSSSEAKVDSVLLTAADASKGRRPVAPKVQTTVKTDRQGRTSVAVEGTVTSSLLNRISAIGGVVRTSRPADRVVTADVPVAAVPDLGTLPEVRRVSSLASQFVTADLTKPGEQVAAQLNRKERLASVRRQLSAAVAEQDAQRTTSAATGSVVSEGDKTHGADRARAKRHVSGVGIKVGVLSDGVDSLAASIASGNLPADTQVLAPGFGDEGTAMLEIVHDLAPKAKLAFATANDTPEDFAQHIRDLRAAGADVIVDDIIYFAESPFQDGPISQAVADVTKDGALYFSSAGNEGNVDDGTSGNYEGTFSSSGQPVGKFAGSAHDFKPGAGVQLVNPTTANTADVPAILQWADPLGKANDDYDLYALDSADNVVAFSNDIQNGDDDPFEGFYMPDAGGPIHLAVVKYKGADRYFQLTAFRGRFADDGSLKAYVSPGVTRGHSTVNAAYSVAAVPAKDKLPFELEPGDPANPTGPYPNRFTKSQKSERFTSDGPRRMFFAADGTPYTPGNFTSTGGRVRINPDITAADGVSTSVPGFEQFFGTSAAAPHAAALAALALSGHPGLSPAKFRKALEKTALDIEKKGADRDTGRGIVMAEPLLAKVKAKAQPYAVAGLPTVTSSTDGDTYLEPGEQATVAFPVINQGDASAKKVALRLRSSTPGVTISEATKGYGTLKAGQTKVQYFGVRAPKGQALGSTVQLSARVKFRGAFSPLTFTSRIVVGQPASSVKNVAYTGPAVAIPDGDEQGVSVRLNAAGVGPLSKVTFSIDGTSCSNDPSSTTVGLNHSFVNDLVGTLTAPDGTAVSLFANTGADGRNFCQTVFDDSATQSIQGTSGDQAPFTGSWRPAEPLSVLVGKSGNGAWTFAVADLAPADSGSLRKVSIHLTGFAAPPA